ncbi:MAG: ABC transporter substrate-binding protein, partial [Lactobacillales bacterium]|nr:ABC transporter substrate-binding protein [Lactobacillales bacterium]
DKIFYVANIFDPSLSDFRYNYANSLNPDEAARVLAKHLIKHNVKTAAIVGVNAQASLSLTAAAEKQFEKEGIRIVSKILFNSSDRALKLDAAKIKNSNPDVVFIYSYEPILTLFARELRVAGYKNPFVTISAFPFANNKNIFEGAFFADWDIGDRSFVEKYEKAYNAYPQALSPVGYNQIILISNMIEKFGFSKNQTGDEVFKNLSGILENIPSANGRMYIGDNGSLYMPSVLKKMLDGKSVTIKE